MSDVSAGSAAGTPGIVRAAWLAKLGYDELAAKTLAKARIVEMSSEIATSREALIKDLRIALAWRAYADGVHAFMQRADEESLRHISRFNDKYAEFAADFGNGIQLFADLKRRRESNSIGKSAPEKPIDFDQWEKPEQVHWLIGQLDQVDARQSGQPGGVDLTEDWRVQAIIAIGDPAIDELIDTIEQDTRLTRSVHFWRDFARNRTVLSVREAALTAAMTILRVRVFEPVATGDNFTRRGDEKIATTVASLRRYWKKFRDTPFENRMMDVLTNPDSDSESLREAAQNLAQMNEQRTLSTTGTVAMIEGNENYVEKSDNGTSSSSIPDVIADPAFRRQQSELRRCDVVAQTLNAMVIGLPVFHPLMNDADQRLETMRKLLDTKSGSLRRASDEEREKYDRLWGPVYVIE